MRIAIGLIFTTCASLATASSGPQLPQLRQQIQEKGAKNVVTAMFANRSAWNTLTTNIQSGKNDWIDVGIQLKGAADGGASSELQDALFAALATNPRRVLQVSAPTIPAKIICSGRSDPLPTKKEALAELDRIRASVSRISDKNLADQQKDCLAALQEATANTKRFFKN